MQGSVRKKGATWSYRIELGMAAGKRNQVERSGFKTKSEATKAMNEVTVIAAERSLHMRIDLSGMKFATLCAME